MLEKIFPSTEGFDRKIIHMETTLFKVRYKIPQATRNKRNRPSTGRTSDRL